MALRLVAIGDSTAEGLEDQVEPTVVVFHMTATGALYDDLYTRRNPDKAKDRAIDQLRPRATPSPSVPRRARWHSESSRQRYVKPDHRFV
jgi:hypothetical protein